MSETIAAVLLVLGVTGWSSQPPPAMAEIAIPSGGARLNGFVYLAGGAGPHPVVIFLHGYPGNEKNLDLAQAVRRAGYHAMYVDYRGTWGSGGTFSFANSLEDVKAMLAWVRDEKNAAKYHFDVRRIALVGHSFGGWLALMAAGAEPKSVCVAGLAAWNVGAAALRFRDHPDERDSTLSGLRDSTDPAGGPVRANPERLLIDMVSHASEWDYVPHAAALGDRALLLVAATNDSPDENVAMHQRLADAARRAGNRHVNLAQFDDDHPFSAHRLELADLLTKWLSSGCAGTQGD